MMKYATITAKGQITLPAEMRRALHLRPGKKLHISLQGDNICISKPVDIAEVRKALQKQVALKGTGKKNVRGGDGWTAHVKEQYGSKS